MPLPDSVAREVDLILGDYCRTKVPDRLKDRLRLGYRVRGNSVTLYEERPRFDNPAEWIEIVVAQYRFLPKEDKWTLYWADRNSRWHLYEDAEPDERLQELLDEVERDPTGIFWG
jgi:hypothetical protein